LAHAGGAGTSNLTRISHDLGARLGAVAVCCRAAAAQEQDDAHRGEPAGAGMDSDDFERVALRTLDAVTLSSTGTVNRFKEMTRDFSQRPLREVGLVFSLFLAAAQGGQH